RRPGRRPRPRCPVPPTGGTPPARRPGERWRLAWRAIYCPLVAPASLLCTMLLIVSGRDDAGSTAPQFVTRIGGRIRALRKQRGWSVQRLAEAGTVSRRMLTQIELGQANPSLATVDRVARALDTDFAALALPSAEAEGGGAEGALVWQAPDGSHALLLGATEEPRAELWRWTLAPAGPYAAQPNRPGA